MELEWPSMVTSLEPMRPLSPEIHYNEQINIATDVDKLTRGERASKLLDHFDELQQEESEPFDWFPNEKSIDIPIFESLPSPPFPDLKPSSQTYALPTTICINAADYQQLQQYPPSLLSPNLYDPVPPPVSYSLSPQHPQPSPLLVTTATASTSSSSSIYDNCGVKIECDPLSAAASAPSDAEWLKSETLTPPESPKDEEFLKMLEEIEPEALARLVMARADQLDPSTPLTFADEEEDMSFASPDSHFDDCANSSVCSRSRSVSPCTTSDGGLDDPEWTPPSRAHQHSPSARGNKNSSSSSDSSSDSSSNKSANTKYASGAACGGSSGGTAAARRRASKPYKKPVVEERRERKKEQNKNAATRYRMKKKVEVEVVKQEEQLLVERNEELRKQLDDVSREVRYLKSLMRELYCKKGIIK